MSQNVTLCKEIPAEELLRRYSMARSMLDQMLASQSTIQRPGVAKSTPAEILNMDLCSTLFFCAAAICGAIERQGAQPDPDPKPGLHLVQH